MQPSSITVPRPWCLRCINCLVCLPTTVYIAGALAASALNAT